MVGHTPGPWKQSKTGTSVNAGGIRISQSGYVGGASVYHQQQAHETRLANARLIAAAPDLLEACRSVLSSFAGMILEDDLTNTERACISTIRAAMTKATGIDHGK